MVYVFNDIPSIVIGASEASPVLVMNVEILSVCLSVCHRLARYLFFVIVTLYQLLRDMLRMGTRLATLSNKVSNKIQRLLRPQTRLQQVRAAQMGTFWAWDHTDTPACKTVAIHTCDHGYSLSGDATRNCTTNAINAWVWSGSKLTCLCVFNIALDFIIIPFISCSHPPSGLWLSYHHYQWISWNTHQHNLPRDSDLHLCQWVWSLHWSHHNNGYLYG